MNFYLLSGVSYQTQQKLKEQALDKKRRLKHKHGHDSHLLLLLIHTLSRPLYARLSLEQSTVRLAHSSNSDSTSDYANLTKSLTRSSGKSDSSNDKSIQNLEPLAAYEKPPHPIIKSKSHNDSTSKRASASIQSNYTTARGPTRNSDSFDAVSSTSSSLSLSLFDTASGRKNRSMESSQSSLHAEPSRKSSNLNYGYNSDLLEVLEVSKMLHKAHKEHHSSGSSHHQHHHHKLDKIVESKHKLSRHKHKNNDIPQSDDLSRVDTHYSSIISPTGESFDFSRNEENEESEGVETQTEGGLGYDGSSVYMLADEYEKFTLDSRAEYDLECEPEDNKLTRVYSNVSSIFSTKTDKKSTNATIESGHRFMRLKDNLRS